MIIDFGSMELTPIPNFVGGEGTVHTRTRIDELGKLMKATLEPGSSIGLHTHATSSEVIYILSGSGEVLYDGEYETVTAGSCHYCPKGHTHSLINTGAEPMEILAVVANQ